MKGRGSQISRTRKDPDWGERPGLPPTANINAAKRSLQTKVKQVDSRPPTKVGDSEPESAGDTNWIFKDPVRVLVTVVLGPRTRGISRGV